MWKKKASKVILNHPRLKVFEDRVILPSGKMTTYIRYFSGEDAVTIIARNAEGKIVVSREYSYPPNKVLWQFPGGSIHSFETPKQAVVRELREEVKLRPKKVELLGSYFTNNRRSHTRMFVFIATKLVSAPLKGDIEEEITNFWFTEKQVEKLIKKGEIENVHFLAAWSLYKLR